jgi:hypothetical protein|nr:MAG TPA: Head fiber protein [Caudoviricetes sp.]
MSDYTEHYNLKKPLKTENYDVDVANTNNDIIDEKIYNKVDKISGRGLSTNDFTNEYKKKIDRIIEGTKGDSAYQIAVKNGFEGTEEKWLESLKGDKGDKGELVDLIKEEEGKNISIESANLPAIEVSIEGESQQATRTGKNSLDNTATTKISNGITFTVNSDKTVLADGTNDTSANSSLVINRYDLSPGTYILNGCPSGGASNTYRLAIQETGSYSILGSIDIGNGSGEFTIDTTTNVQIAIFIQKGLTVNNLLFKPMLRKATIADDTYEQYGASPSPDYLSEIENLEGENICPSLNTTRTINGVTFTKNKDGSITMNGTATADATYPINVNTTTNTRTVLLKANSNYRMLSSYESGKYTTQVFYLKNNVMTYSSSSSSLIETVEETKAGMYIRVYKDAVLDNITIYPQITKGEEYKPYVPYNSLEFKDVGSNVLELSKGTVTLNGVTLTSDGETITINGTVSGNYPAVKLTNGLKAATSLETLVNNYISERVAQLEDIKDCTIQSIISGGSSTFTPYIGSYNKTVRELWYGIGTPAKTIQTSSTSLIAIYLGGKGSTYNNYKIKIGINKGTVAKAYEPYKQQTECFPLSEGQKLYKNSYLADDGIHHKRNQVVLDGSDDEGWTLFNSKKNSYKLSNFINGNGNDNSFNYPILSNYFKSDTQANVFEGVKNTIQALGGNVNGLYISFGKDSDINSVSLLRTFLKAKYDAGTPVIVEYELAEEEIVPYTETQKEAREKIKNMILYKGTNNISCTGKLKIKYYTNEEMNEIYAKKEDLHEHANKSILDQTQEAFTTELKNKLDGLNNYVLPAPTSASLGGVKAGSNITIDADGTINAQLGSSGETSANDYEVLSNKPQIAGITLQGNKSLADLGIQGVETGKGLSSNDYTTTEKAKLAGVEAQANKYIHPNTSGNKHVPSGGSSGQVLKWKSDGTAQWDNLSSSGELGTDDLNSKKINGIYAQSTATNFLKSRNYPFDHADGFPFFDILLEVKNAGMYIMQELHLSYKISVQGQEVISYFTYMRFSTNNGSTWSAWRGHEGTTTQ